MTFYIDTQGNSNIGPDWNNPPGQGKCELVFKKSRIGNLADTG